MITPALDARFGRDPATAKKPRRKAQWERVLRYMQTHDCITSAIAFDALRITSLHRRLTDIERKTDYQIDRKRIDVPNRPHHYEYRLIQSR